MAQDFPVVAVDGSEVAIEDLNAGWRAAGLADDRVLAELFRMLPYNGATAKGVMPYGLPQGQTGGSGTTPYLTSSFVQCIPGGDARLANGAVLVMPCRVLVGTRQAVAADPNPQTYPPTYNSELAWSDVRSCIFAKSTDGVNQGIAVPFAANSSGYQRWDTVYAVFQVDEAYTSQTRIVKPPADGTAAPTNTNTLTTQSPRASVGSATIGVVTGTPSPVPGPGAFPADVPSTGTYYVPLAQVWVPNGYTPGTFIPTENVQQCAPVLALSERATGAATAAPTTINLGQNASAYSSWATSIGYRPNWMMPATMVGQRTLYFAFDPNSLVFGDAVTIDTSVDWRYRVWRWFLYGSCTNNKFIWQQATAADAVPSAFAPTATGYGFGQSFIADDNAVLGITTRQGCVVAWPSYRNAPNIFASPQGFALYVDRTSGALKLYNPLPSQSWGSGYLLFMELTASGQFDNPL